MAALIDQQSSLKGWSRIIAILTQVGLLAAVSVGSPENAIDLGDISTQGEGIIKSGFALYTQIGLLVSTLVTTYSKYFAMYKWR